MEIKICQLSDPNSPYLPQIIKWQYKTWGKKDGLRYDCVESNIRHSIMKDRIPLTYIALVDGELAGYHQIDLHDMEARPDIYPWLINLFVVKKFRKQGVASALLKNVPNVLKKLKINHLYLYTSVNGMYEKFGWEFVEMIEPKMKHQDKFVRLYKFTAKNTFK